MVFFIVIAAYHVHFSTGMFPDACCDWKSGPILKQTWATFKINFALAHKELRNLQVTSNQAGYQQAANAAYDTASLEDIQQETVLAIANLATTTASDRSIVANLTATNSSGLSTKLNLSNAKLNAATAELSALNIAIASVCTTGTQQATTTHSQPPPYVTNSNYCWTHS
jgi:hypothetical protein